MRGPEALAPRRVEPRDIALAAGTYAILAGVVTLTGWFTGTYRLTDWTGAGISMKANPAVASIAAGLALVIAAGSPTRGLTAVLVRALAFFVALIGGLTLLQHLTGADFGIDTFLADEPPGTRATAAPGRMGPPASISFLLISTAIVLAAMGRRARQSTAILAGLVAFVAGVSVVGYLFGADRLYDVPRLTGISVQMATVLLGLAVGIFAAVPESGLVGALRREDAGGLMARRLLLPILVIPILLGWLASQAVASGLFAPAFGAAVFALSMVVTMAALTIATARRVTQADLELRDADRRKDQFLATLAHELRNPLAPIRNSLEILRLVRDDAGRREVALRTMDRQLRHMVRLVDDLLDVSRITRDRLELRMERVDLMAVLREAAEACRPAIDSVNQSMTLSLAPEPAFVRGDPVRLMQAFGNLVHNASKFTEPGGRIEVRAERQGSEVVVAVEDSGIGIAPHMLPRIFEMFVQGDRSLDRSRGGLGIGLSLSRRLIEMHGGTLTASSPGEGEGSSFVARLPVGAGEPATAEHSPEETPMALTAVERELARPSLAASGVGRGSPPPAPDAG